MERKTKFKLLPNWQKTTEIYSLKNDQKMQNIYNLIAPCKRVISVFFVDEEPKLGFHMFDRMIRDYDEITDNLKLLKAGQLEINEKEVKVYFVQETKSNVVIAHLFFEKEDKLYAFVFSIDLFDKNITKTVKENVMFLETLKLLKENL